MGPFHSEKSRHAGTGEQHGTILTCDSSTGVLLLFLIRKIYLYLTNSTKYSISLIPKSGVKFQIQGAQLERPFMFSIALQGQMNNTTITEVI